MIQQFFKNAGEVQGEKPWSLSADSEISAPCFWRTEKRVRKSTDSSALSGISSRRGDYFIKLFLIEKTEQKSGDYRWFPALPAFLIDNQFSLTKSLSVFLLLYCLKTLFQVCQDIVNMLDTDGQTNGGRCDAGCQQFFLCHL